MPYKNKNYQKAYQKKYQKLYRVANSESIKVYQRAYQTAYRRGLGIGGRTSSCSSSEYQRDYQAAYRKNNIDKVRAWDSCYAKTEKGRIRLRRSAYKSSYGMSLTDVELMYRKQKGLCACCCGKLDSLGCKRKDKTKMQPCVDHNHKTGKVRAIVCIKCNFLFGYANDSVDILKRAIKYLRLHDCPY